MTGIATGTAAIGTVRRFDPVTDSAESGWALQQAVHQVLQNAGITAYDHVPANAVFPYVVLGTATAAPWDDQIHTGMNHAITLNIRSRYRGAKEIKTLMRGLYDLLHRDDLVVAGQSTVSITQEFSALYTDVDGLTRHGVMRFRVLTEFHS